MTQKPIKLAYTISQKYGKEILKDFALLWKKPFWNLTDLANKYGFTREWARQIFKWLYGQPYGDLKRLKHLQVCEDMPECYNDPRYKAAEWKKGDSGLSYGVEIEKLFYDYCEEKGFDIKIPHGTKYDIIINGKNVDVKGSRKIRKTVKGLKTGYCVYAIKHNENVDYFACFHFGLKCFFIIPNEEVKGQSTIYISFKPDGYYNSKNRYWQYKEAWHLLN